MKFIVFLGAFLWHLMPVSAQVKGMVKDNQGEPVVAANVFWINTTNGTVTDERMGHLLLNSLLVQKNW